MDEAILQIQNIIVYLSIGLISVTFPIYAICVTYQRQEKWETEKELKKREELIKNSINKLTQELKSESISSLRKQLQTRLENYEEDLANIKERYTYLTANCVFLWQKEEHDHRARKKYLN